MENEIPPIIGSRGSAKSQLDIFPSVCCPSCDSCCDRGRLLTDTGGSLVTSVSPPCLCLHPSLHQETPWGNSIMHNRHPDTKYKCSYGKYFRSKCKIVSDRQDSEGILTSPSPSPSPALNHKIIIGLCLPWTLDSALSIK